MMLADLGAEVDKLEDPSGGDYLRFVPPLASDSSQDAASKNAAMNAAFLFLNRGKRSVVLDLKRAEGQDAFRRLVLRYDVLVESFRPGVMARFGLDYGALALAHPGLIYCALTGYGQDGPLSERAGHDIGFLARAGVLGQTGPIGGPPEVPGVQMADVAGALFAVSGISSALYARDHTGIGRFIDVSMCESAMMLGSFGLMSALAGEPRKAGETVLSGGVAAYRTYRTKDGRAMALGALEPKFWAVFCGGVGLSPSLEALTPGPHQAEWIERLETIFGERSFAEWVEFASSHDCCLEPVLEPSEVPHDPQHVARNMFVSRNIDSQALLMPRTPIAKEIATGPAPTQGRDTRAVLSDAGFSEQEVDALIAGGVAR